MVNVTVDLGKTVPTGYIPGDIEVRTRKEVKQTIVMWLAEHSERSSTHGYYLHIFKQKPVKPRQFKRATCRAFLAYSSSNPDLKCQPFILVVHTEH